ncbi:hypothetical protein [Saccharomonospora glauca]|jgi:pimeloyl-ACP methyl ester carboxylesterase|uniref:Uncharacterized protein n=1 Tax=Saccharomonospora glauca K62 TaxID=928724 RepID=I1D3I5_9PSEU|nr:hypothetical protein [Saccharomonospora glauca]EIE99509.1 hypothetical protein SacglDRAFT_02617 [Saccharomonospora glauca K62]
MRDFHDDEVRGAGPSVVWQGPEHAPVVLVLDPAGEAKHDTLPATWRPLAEHLRVGWFRLPAEVGDAPSVEDVMGDGSERVHLVAAATAAEAALRLAEEHADRVRSVVVVDPAPMAAGEARVDSAGSYADWWDSDTAAARQRLLARGVRVAAFVSRESDPAVRVEPPVPLGHPDVVGRVVQLLLSFQGDRADPEPVEPERDEIVAAWRAVRKRFGPALERARRSGG